MLGVGGDKISIIYIVFIHLLVSVSSLGYFLSVVYSSKLSHYSLKSFLGAHYLIVFQEIDGKEEIIH